jgi:hypothetical protein
LSAVFRMKLLGSGSVEILRQKESRGKCPLVVAADTGLTSGDGVTHAMIGGRQNGNCTVEDACGVCKPRLNKLESVFGAEKQRARCAVQPGSENSLYNDQQQKRRQPHVYIDHALPC